MLKRDIVLLVDLDGTLVDTFPDLLASAMRALKAHQVPVRQKSLNEHALKVQAGLGSRPLLEALVDDPTRISEDVLQTMLADYRDNFLSASQPFAGTQVWWQMAKIAIVTNKPMMFAKPLLAALYPNQQYVLVTPETTGYAKPNTQPLTFAVQALGSTIADAIMVGDTFNDYYPARDLNMAFVSAIYGYTTADMWHNLPILGKLEQPEDLVIYIEQQMKRP